MHTDLPSNVIPLRPDQAADDADEPLAFYASFFHWCSAWWVALVTAFIVALSRTLGSCDRFVLMQAVANRVGFSAYTCFAREEDKGQTSSDVIAVVSPPILSSWPSRRSTPRWLAWCSTSSWIGCSTTKRSSGNTSSYR